MHVHVIGAGLAGLSAAVALSEAGQTVTVVEAGPVAGGRCRSYFDRELGLRIDNGNHLLLSGNRSAFAYLDTIGARSTLTMPAEPRFPFLDLGNGLRWTLRPNLGRIPWWVLLRQRRAPGTHATDHLALLRLRRITGDATVADSLRKDERRRSADPADRCCGAEYPARCRVGAAAERRDARDAVPRRLRLHPGVPARRTVGKPDRSRGGVAAGARLPGDHRPADRGSKDAGWPCERTGHHRRSDAGRGGGACGPTLGRCRPAA